MPGRRAVVVGAGIAGLLAARRLRDAGLSVVVVERRDRIGGRLATQSIGPARLDTGAQFFTVRSDRFRALTDGWLDDGIVWEWCRGFDQPPARPDGYPRYAGTAGMAAVAASLAATLTGGPDRLDVRTGVAVAGLHRTPEGSWRVVSDRGPVLQTDAVVCTAPVPLTLELLRQGGTALPAESRDALEAVRYEPTLAVLAVLDQPSSVPAPGGLQPSDGAFGFVADNQAKGVSAVPAVTLHAIGEISRARWDDTADTVVRDLVREGSRWLGAGPVTAAELVRWRYARPTVLHPEACLVAVDGTAPLVCAGDAFGPARVEGAASSGWAAAEAVIDRIS